MNTIAAHATNVVVMTAFVVTAPVFIAADQINKFGWRLLNNFENGTPIFKK